LVTLKVGYLPVATWAPLFLAQDRGYFQEVGVEVEASPFGNYATQVPLIAQGQLHIAGCANAVICYNAFGRGLDLRSVTDLQSAGQTEKSRGASSDRPNLPTLCRDRGSGWTWSDRGQAPCAASYRAPVSPAIVLEPSPGTNTGVRAG
jgi:hypothetical protein